MAVKHRLCVKCGAEFVPGSPIAKYCGARCRPRHRGPQPKTSSTARGYGGEHQTARKAALARLRDGEPCSRCGRPMFRTDDLDLDHTDDRRGYRGLAHALCNRRAGALKRAATRRRVTSRDW